MSLRTWGITALIAAAACGQARADEPEPAGKGFFRRHVWHLVTAFGTNLVSNEYEGAIGTSTDPLVFSDPSGFDQSARELFRRDDPPTNWMLENRSKTAVLMGTGAIVLANLGREHAGRWMADDAIGFLEVWYFDKGANGLAKNIFGRQRPKLEFIDDDPNATAASEQELEQDENQRHSFWSGATSRQFALMSYLNRVVSARVHSRPARFMSFVGFYGFATYVGYSRIAQDEHYATDVIAGAAAGILTARAFYRAHHPPRAKPDHEGPRVSLSSLAATRGGVTMMFSVRM